MNNKISTHNKFQDYDIWEKSQQATASSYYLQQKSHPLILIGRSTQKALCVQGDEAKLRLVRGPHSHGTGAGRLGRVEHFLATKQDVIERVGLAIACVAKYREDLDPSHVPTAQLVQKLRLTVHLHLWNKAESKHLWKLISGTWSIGWEDKNEKASEILDKFAIGCK